METLRLTGIKRLEQLQTTIINDCTFIPFNTQIRVDATVDSEMLMDPIPFQSTYGRELWFCCHHAVIISGYALYTFIFYLPFVFFFIVDPSFCFD